MTTVQTFEDILAAMRDNPVLREAMRQHVRDEEFNARVLSEAYADAASTDTWEAATARMEEQLNYLVDVNYEDKIRGRLKRAVRRYFDIINAETVYSRVDLGNIHIHNLLDRAMDADLISEDEEFDLVLIDFILLGQTPDGEPAYVVIESSVTIDEHDVDRAARRARILQTASSIATQAVVIGTTISDVNRQRANDSGVTYIATAE